MDMASFLPLLWLSWFLFAHFFCLVVIAERSTYIVQLDKSLMPKVFATHHHWHSSTIESIKIPTPALLNSCHPVPKLLYSYYNVFHGFSAVLSKDELDALKIGLLKLTQHTPPSFLSSILPLLCVQIPVLAKIVIGVLDSGVWPESPVSEMMGCLRYPKNGREYVGQAWSLILHCVTRNLLGPIITSIKGYWLVILM